MSGLAYPTPVIGGAASAGSDQPPARLADQRTTWQRLRPQLRTVRFESKNKSSTNRGTEFAKCTSPPAARARSSSSCRTARRRIIANGRRRRTPSADRVVLRTGRIVHAERGAGARSVGSERADDRSVQRRNGAEGGALFIRTDPVLPGAHDAGHADHGVQR
jgi:hypothetical protein